MATATPKLEKRKDKKTGELIIKNVPILIDFTFDGQRLWVATGENIDTNKWDEKNKRVKSSVIGSAEINEVIKSKCEEIQKLYREAKMTGNMPSPSYLRNKLNEDKTQARKSLVQYYEEFIEGYRLKGAKGTVTKLKTNLKHLVDFGRKQRLSIGFETITPMFLNKYVEYFQIHLNHTNGTIARNIKVLKWFLNWATKYEYNKNFAYKSFSVKYQEPEIIALTDDELIHLYTLKIENECLQQVRDVFCFSCFTTLRYSDVKNLKKTDINNGVISITSIKTKNQVTVPLIAEAQKILSNYTNTLSKKALPVISNQKMNDYLKELGKLASLTRPITKIKFRGSERIEKVYELWEVLTTHIGRKTAISFMFRHGIDSELIRAISNHKSVKSFARYNCIDDKHKETAMHLAFKNINYIAEAI